MFQQALIKFLYDCKECYDGTESAVIFFLKVNQFG